MGPLIRATGLPFCAATRRRLRDEDGWGLVEALVAALLLSVGLLATFVMLDATVEASYVTRAREGGVTLARQLTDDARSIPFSQLSSGTIEAQLQALPGLANQSSGPDWEIARRGVTYTVTTSVTSYNDTKDATASGELAVKEVAATVQWTVGGLTRTFQEVATMSSAGQVLGLSTSNLDMVSPSVSTQPTISDPSVTQLQFQVAAPAGTTSIVWSVDGVAQSSWTSSNSGTTWTSSTWTISGASDGTYQIGAQAENGQGVIGPAVTIPVTLIRNVPSAPTLIQYGFNSNLYSGGQKTTAVEIDWRANPERNVTGYRLYNPSGTLLCTTTNSTSNSSCGSGSSAWCADKTSCIDLSPPAPTSSNLTYQVAATYYDANGNLQQGPTTNVTLSGTPSTTFTLAPTANNVGSNCSGSPAYDLRTTYTPASDVPQSGGDPVFCSRSFTSGQNFESGGTANAYLTNPASTACPVTATLNVDGSSSGALTSTVTLPASMTTVTKYAFNWGGGQLLTMSAGDRFNLSFNMTGTGCGTGTKAAVLHYGGTTYPSQFTTAVIPIDAPVQPASLTVAPQSDGTAVLTWPEPTSGAPISFYRVYRDGQDYTSRYDIADTTDCSNGMCTYMDRNRSSSHSYYVTAVGDTTAGSDMAESPQTGPVTG
jgi:Tfp pilus assembly protein PilV